MQHQTLSKAVAEAERFLKAARKLQSVTKPEPVDVLSRTLSVVSYDHPVERGAVMRSSMDLTRALADLRQGR
jgi:hypothetical protein